MGFHATQDCVGAFGVQQVCVKLQELDYYGHFYNRTTWHCSKETAAEHAYAGWSATCKGLREGTFRTSGRGTAWPVSAPVRRYGYTKGVHLCVGF